ncbi:hypothetical protein [Prauserella shujinwangii]|uniref:hypothetical protein n=1 Tax=Prauserella shujinwangii TaxID=1453103 RepID=UPI001FE7C421|nr:hypothetical protein [Prauserella shujinwangii]
MGSRVRGWLIAVVVLAGSLGGTPAALAEVPAPEPVCTVGDERLAELSGLVTTGDGWYAVNDGGSRLEVFALGRDCAVRDVLTDPTDPYDVEDLALAGDGTLWLGDTGDNDRDRDTVALHAFDPGGGSVLYRLTYPDGPHDAEALLLDPAGTPYVITKNMLGDSGVYRPARELSSPGPTPLERVGTLRLTATDTPGGPLGGAGSVLVTGAATMPDGSVVAVRTYTDAYLYPVPDGDVVAALRQQPVRVPLPHEPQGEAIAFERDGTLLSASEGVGTPIRAVPGAAGLVSAASQDRPDASREGGDGGPSPGTAEPDGEDGREGLPVLPGIAVAVFVAAVLVFGIDRLRRRR